MADHRHTAGRGYVSGCPGCKAARKTANDQHRAKDNGAVGRADGWRRQGIDPAAAEALHRAGGGCQICRRTDRRMHIDHDHATGLVRGRLCGPCNQAIGLLNDSPALLEAARKYLTKE